MKDFLITLWFGIREPFRKTNYVILFIILILGMLVLFTLIPVWTVAGNTLATQLKIFTFRDYAVLTFLSGLSALFITFIVAITLLMFIAVYLTARKINKVCTSC